jgi:nucleoside-diphosphate-sugar epimerase
MGDPIIALTGATGFIGKHILRELTGLGHHVRVLLRTPTALPANCTSAVIGDLNRPMNMAQALAGVDTIIHSAGNAPMMTGLPADDFRQLSAKATGALAKSAKHAGVRRFIFMSSLRAQAGASTDRILTEDLQPEPADPYGQSKLAAEQELSRLELDWVALRLASVVGPGVGGNIASLIRLARSPFPLPFGALRAQRSLLSLDNLVAGVLAVSAVPQPLRTPLIVADPDPLNIPQMLTAIRAGLGRRPGLIHVPTSILARSFQLAGRSELFRRIAEPLVADPGRLLQLGWVPRVTTFDSLAAVAQREEGAISNH